MEDGKIVIKAQIDDSGLDSGLKEVESKVGKSANSVMNIVKGLSIHDVITKAMGTAVKFAKEVNQATESVSAKLKGASTLYQGVAVDQNQLLQNLGAIASKTGADLETLGQSVYDALSAGVKPTEDMADVLKVVEASAKLAAGGFTDTSTALSATMKVINSYSMDLKELDRVQGILMQTQNSGITTVDELGASLAQVVPTASSFGVSFENVGAAIAEMTKQGTKTAQATTALNAIIAELGKNGTTAAKNLKAAAEASGMSATSFREMLDSGMNLSEILDVMSDYAEENGLSMVDMFSSIDAGKASLQLTGKAGEDFNAIMDSMSESAGLVQEAFEKTVDPSQKLSAAWNNLLVTLGTKFKPAADSVRLALADMLTKMSGQYSATDDLLTSYGKLETALNDYKKLQDESAGKTDILTQSMLAQAKAALESATQEASIDYSKALEQIDKLERKIGKLDQSIIDNSEIANEIIADTGYTLQEVIGMTQDERLYNLANMIGYDNLGDLNDLLKDITKAEKEKLALDIEKDGEAVKQAKFIDILTQGYLEENEATLKMLAIYPELEQEVLDNVDAYKALEKAKEDASKAGDGGSGDGGSGGSGGKPETPTSTKYGLADFEKEMTELNAGFNKLQNESEKTGIAFTDNGEKLSALTSLYVKAIKNGIDPKEHAMGRLLSQIQELTPAIEEEATKEQLLSAELEEVVEKYNNLAMAGELLGEQLYDNDKFVGELTSLYKKYVEEGVDPASEAMQELVGWIEAFEQSTDESKEKWKKFGKDLIDISKSATVSISQGLGKSVEEAFESFLTKGERLSEIDKQLKEIGDETSGKLKDAIDDVAAAQIEYDVALKRGDKVAIENAEKKLDQAKKTRDALEEQSKTLKDNRKSVEDNTDSWKAFGKSALESLASVLEGLAGQLAAMAVSTYPNFGQMFLSGAASAAAYVAAGYIRAQSQKFATGGIVKGNSYTGDNIPVRVNAGELILNMAQQETLARMLESSVALANMAAGEGYGRGITVNLSGAYIYGLDEPAVGKAIYENIEQLKYEGVI